MISTRAGGSDSPTTVTHSPNRSSSWGRSSPSSGFIVPTSENRAGWVRLMPSRSTVLTPIAAESSSRSTTWSSRRFTSSTYRMPRWASASSPGSNRLRPAVRAVSRSSVPATRSSVAPIGSSTTGTRVRRSTGSSWAGSPSSSQYSRYSAGDRW